jgi:hypothetical protein
MKKTVLISILAVAGLWSASCSKADNPVSPELDKAKPHPVFAADADTIRVAAEPATCPVNVTQATIWKWTAKSSATWCALNVTDTDTLSGGKALSIAVEANSGAARTATVTLQEIGNRRITIPVIQVAAP